MRWKILFVIALFAVTSSECCACKGRSGRGSSFAPQTTQMNNYGWSLSGGNWSSANSSCSGTYGAPNCIGPFCPPGVSTSGAQIGQNPSGAIYFVEPYWYPAAPWSQARPWRTYGRCP